MHLLYKYKQALEIQVLVNINYNASAFILVCKVNAVFAS